MDSVTFSVTTLAPVFYKLLYMSLTAVAVGAAVLLVRRFADKRISPFWKYAMWALVLAALILPWRPQSRLAVMNPAEKIQEVHFRGEYDRAKSEYHIIRQTENPTPEQIRRISEVKSKKDTLHFQTLLFDSLLPTLWLFGAAAAGLLMLAGLLRLGGKIRNSALPSPAARYETILQSCKEKLGVRRRVQILLQSHIKTPALFGLLRPMILLPDYAEDLSDAHLEYVVLHELSHLRRGDCAVNALLLLLQAAYWFNPLIWLLFRFIREDMELANDAAVLKNMGAEERREYSLSLVEVLAGCGRQSLAPRLLCMVDHEKNIARRIGMIKLGGFFKRRRLVIAVSGLLVIAAAAALFLTKGAKKDSPPRDSLLWARTLKEADVARIEAISYDSSEPVQLYKDLNANEIKLAVDFINRSKGSYTQNPTAYARDNGMLYITTKNGKIHSVRNHGDIYLIIDGAFWKADSDWLRAGFRQFAGRGPVPDDFWSRMHTGSGKRAPGVKAEIEEWTGEADDALEPIYEDKHYRYSLSSIRSDKIMLAFEDGKRLSLKDALARRKIGMADLILNGLQVYMEPKNNPLGGSFNATALSKYTFGDIEFFPSDIFMYMYIAPGSGSDRTAAFAYGELAKYIQKFGGAKPPAKPPAEETLTVEGVVYITEKGLNDIGIPANIGWLSIYSNRMIPVRFSFSDASGASSAPYAEEDKYFRDAAQISSGRFLAVKKGMTMKALMAALGDTVHIIGQGPSAMYYIVDGQPLKIDFVNLDDPYPFSGYDMKQYFDAYKAVTFRIVPTADVKRLKKGMTREDITDKILGGTVDVGSGRHILKYVVWDGLAFHDLTFNFGGGRLPYSGEEICGRLAGGSAEITW